MDDLPGLLARDFGFRPQGKAVPMSSSTFTRNPSSNATAGSTRSASSSTPPTAAFDDVFGGAHASSNASSFDSILHGYKDSKASSFSSMPVYDKPLYDDDIFDGVPGIKNPAASEAKFDDVFASMSNDAESAHAYDDLLDNLGKATVSEAKAKRSDDRAGLDGFEELIPGFGGSSPPPSQRLRKPPETNSQESAVPPVTSTKSMVDDPFVVLGTTSTSTYSSSGLFSDPLEQISRIMNSGTAEVNASSTTGGLFDDINAFDGFVKSAPPFTSETNNIRKEKSPQRGVRSPGHSFSETEPSQKSSTDNFENPVPKMASNDRYQETSQNIFEKPNKSSHAYEDTGRSGVQSSDANAKLYERSNTSDPSPKSNECLGTAEDVWLTVDEITLFTLPTAAPPPSRPPPPLVIKNAPFGKTDQGPSAGFSARRIDNEPLSQSNLSYPFSKLGNDSVKSPGSSPIDELEEFAMGKPPSYADVFSNEEEIERNSAAAASAAAMKEAMDRAEAKFKHAKEVRERERDAKSARSRELGQEEKDGMMPDSQDFEDKEKQVRLDREREQIEREEREREQQRREKEREVELQRERERGRQAVGRATREARERAATEARLKAERAAVEKANTEARQRAERAAVQRAAAEARERAVADARERAEKEARAAKERAAAEAREKAEREAKDRAAATAKEKATVDARERAAVERANAEARLRAERAAVERANAEARERAAAAARERQNTNENDLESFFGMNSRPNSAPKQRAASSETVFDAQAQSKGSFDVARRTSSSTSSSNIRKASSTTNIVDDLTSIFGAPPSGEFPEVEGETEERRRARLERHQRTQERALKAVAEKNERDRQTQREQEERHRIAETLDIEIKRWSAGKEGNLRALLSTLQYVLWPGCGWEPVSLSDLMMAASVKKVYRRATLCIHPDKVQQKGANLQQKYIAEKVFDLLKEAWNKLNSEELF